MEIARREIETTTAQRRVKEALKHRVSKGYPQFEFGDRVMVYREELKRYDGPFTVHSFDNNRTVEVQIRNTIVPMSTSVVKKVDLDNDNTSEEEEESNNVSHNPLTDIVTELAERNRDDAEASSEVKNPIEHAAETFLASDIGKRELLEFSKNNVSKVFATVIVKDKRDPRFTDAKKKELQELLKKGTYQFIKENHVPQGATIL